LLRFERKFWSEGLSRLAGVDEAGRGPLAGPVVAAAVVLDRTLAEAEEHGILREVTDSKKLSPATREALYDVLAGLPSVEIGVGEADVDEIDAINILHATHLAMARAIRALPSLPDRVLVDGLAVSNLPCASTAIVRGDAQSLSIAAASIVAKVVRDRCMRETDKRYPQYGFAQHKGYGTAAHVQALLEFGPCPEHRRTFRPVHDAIGLRRRAGQSGMPDVLGRNGTGAACGRASGGKESGL
jgi:ribonuclease HII